MSRQPLGDEELDLLLFDALREEEAVVPGLVRQGLQKELEKKGKSWRLAWWVPATAGVLQTAAGTGIVWMLLPGSWLSLLTAAAGTVMSVSSCMLWGLTRKTWKEEAACR